MFLCALDTSTWTVTPSCGRRGTWLSLWLSSLTTYSTRASTSSRVTVSIGKPAHYSTRGYGIKANIGQLSQASKGLSIWINSSLGTKQNRTNRYRITTPSTWPAELSGIRVVCRVKIPTGGLLDVTLQSPYRWRSPRLPSVIDEASCFVFQNRSISHKSK